MASQKSDKAGSFWRAAGVRVSAGFWLMGQETRTNPLFASALMSEVWVGRENSTSAETSAPSRKVSPS